MNSYSNSDDVISVDEINVSNTFITSNDPSYTSSSFFSVVLSDETPTIETDFDLAFGKTKCELHNITEDLGCLRFGETKVTPAFLSIHLNSNAFFHWNTGWGNITHGRCL